MLTWRVRATATSRQQVTFRVDQKKYKNVVLPSRLTDAGWQRKIIAHEVRYVLSVNVTLGYVKKK